MRRALPLTFAVLAVAAAPAHAAPVSFAKPLLVDAQKAGGEPVLWADPVHHTLLYSSHAGTTHLYRPGFESAGGLDFLSTYRNQVFMWRSQDDGASFTPVDFGGGFTTNPAINQGFSDPDFTEDAGGRIYNTGIDLVNDAVFSSPDGGKTWDTGTIQCTPADRPWLAGGRKDEVFMSANVDAPLPGASGHQVFDSTDAGASCPLQGINADGTTADGESWTGNGKILYDRATDTVVEPANFGSPIDGVGIDTWHRGDKAFTPSRAAKTTQFAHWPSIAIDDGGTLYEVWDENPSAGGGAPHANAIDLVYTKDLGRTWSRTIRIAQPAGHLVIWPWVAAGEAGRVSVVWYETDKVTDIGVNDADFSIMQATILHADDDAHRTIETVDAVGRPIAHSNLCLSGTTCVATGEDRRLGDFFTNAVGLDGCAVIASGDTTHKDPVTGGELPTSRPIFLRQTSGPRLRGSGDCNGTPDPGADLGLPPSKPCLADRTVHLTLRAPRHARLRNATVTVNGRRVTVTRRGGMLRATLRLRSSGPKRFTVRIVARTTRGKVVRSTRVYRTCVR